jgi:hypothetical protein
MVEAVANLAIQMHRLGITSMPQLLELFID